MTAIAVRATQDLAHDFLKDIAMTSTLSPGDTGEIVRPDWVREREEQTQVIRPFEHGYRVMRRPDVDETKWATAVTYIPSSIGVVDQQPRITDDPAQAIAPLERVAGPDETAVVTLLGALGGEPVRLRKSVPAADLLPNRDDWTGPKHRRPSVLATAWARIVGAL